MPSSVETKSGPSTRNAFGLARKEIEQRVVRQPDQLCPLNGGHRFGTREASFQRGPQRF